MLLAPSGTFTMRIADLETCLPDALLRPATAGATTPPVSWFDEADGAAPSIHADAGPGARGLSVTQHAERVLALLYGGETEGP